MIKTMLTKYEITLMVLLLLIYLRKCLASRDDLFKNEKHYSHKRNISLYSRHGFYLTINKYGKVGGAINGSSPDGKRLISSRLFISSFF